MYTKGLPIVVATSLRGQSATAGTCVIKGNRSRRGEWIYHLPGMPYYEQTRPEEIFCTEAKPRPRVTGELLFGRDTVEGWPKFALVEQIGGVTCLIPCLRRSEAIKALSKLVQPLRALKVHSLDVGKVSAFRFRPSLGGHRAILL